MARPRNREDIRRDIEECAEIWAKRREDSSLPPTARAKALEAALRFRKQLKEGQTDE